MLIIMNTFGYLFSLYFVFFSCDFLLIFRFCCRAYAELRLPIAFFVSVVNECIISIQIQSSNTNA